MARIRTIKPEFWTDVAVGECSPTARLLLIASLNFADDQGGLDRSAKQLKAQAFPYDDIDCEPLLQELLRFGLLIEYETGGRKYLHIKGFHKHQRVEKPAAPRFPVFDESMITHPPLPEKSGSPPGVLTSELRSLMEGKGREGNGKEGIKSLLESSTRKVSRETDPDWMPDFKIEYPKRAGDPAWRGAIRSARARMAEGHTPQEFIRGAERYRQFCEATGKIGTEFVQQASRFLGPSKPFLEPWTLPNTKADTRLNSNLSAAEDFLRRTENAA